MTILYAETAAFASFASREAKVALHLLPVNVEGMRRHSMIKTAFAHWNNRIAPVFDIARQIRLVESESGRIIAETEEVLADDLAVQKVIRLAELGVSTLVCGAISKPIHEMVAAYGIEAIPFVAGDLREVIQAWLRGGLAGHTFAMPGCCGRGHRRLRLGHGVYQEEYVMNGKRSGATGQGRGIGQGGGRGQGRGGQGRGRMGGSLAGGPGGDCVCSRCGEKVKHTQGQPCNQMACPKCGAPMARV
jgi:predicted Fe-Mo cluster-binding NifX family protein